MTMALDGASGDPAGVLSGHVALLVIGHALVNESRVTPDDTGDEPSLRSEKEQPGPVGPQNRHPGPGVVAAELDLGRQPRAVGGPGGRVDPRFEVRQPGKAGAVGGHRVRSLTFLEHRRGPTAGVTGGEDCRPH